MTDVYLVVATEHDYLVKWLRMNDVDPQTIPYGAALEVGEHEGDWTIRFPVYATTPDGQFVLRDGDWVTSSRTAPLLFDPPVSWLQPVRGAQV